MNTKIMEYRYNDGGRLAARISGGVSDCVTRALAIATGSRYETVRNYLAPIMTPEGVNVFSREFAVIAEAAGLIYVPTLPRSFKVSQLPAEGIFIAHTSRHVSAVVNGVVYDTFDTRGELVQGYWTEASKKGYNVFLNGTVKLNGHPAPLAAALRMVELFALNYALDGVLTINQEF